MTEEQAAALGAGVELDLDLYGEPVKVKIGVVGTAVLAEMANFPFRDALKKLDAVRERIGDEKYQALVTKVTLEHIAGQHTLSNQQVEEQVNNPSMLFAADLIQRIITIGGKPIDDAQYQELMDKHGSKVNAALALVQARSGLEDPKGQAPKSKRGRSPISAPS